ncbi:MAG: four helix bundle protein [Acidobacteriota bacterium]
MTYRSLEVWQLARDLSIEIHQMAIEDLPRHEMFEEGQQIRRSIKSVRANIVEGYGRRRYKQDFLRFLTYAFASAIDTTDHLECLYETKSLQKRETFDAVHARLEELGKKLNKLIQSVEKEHLSVRDGMPEYGNRQHDDPISNIQHPTSNIQNPSSDEDPTS